ncbi:MAG TPA: cytochrome c biogenesis protein CcdA [Terriglobales bacterium]|nr:cytochrome c biogenesis protein CcdA [Terriglobales bacterium]
MNSVPLTSAFVAGLISFLSPCVLPLVPGYISMISGAGVEELRAGDQKLLRRVLFQSAMFILGFSLVFIAFGASATAIGQFTRTYRYLLAPIAGAVIIIFGLHLTGILKIKALYADKRLHSAGKGSSAFGAFVIGFAFAFGWTPCIGPILGAILTFAAAQDTVSKGVILLTVYSAGLAVPFLLTSLGVERFLAFYGRFRRHLHAVEVISGVLLIVIGALIMTRHFTLLSGYLSFLNRFAM